MGPGNSHDDEPRDEHREGPDDEPDDDRESRPRAPLPDPLDRIWLHPTELSTLGAAFVPAPAPGAARRRSLPWLSPVVISAAGALLTVAVLAVTGAFDRSGAPPVSSPAIPDTTTVLGSNATDTLVRLSPSVVSVVAHDAQGTRRGSGVCVRHGTQLLTSASIVGSAKTVQVVTSDGVTHTADVAGRDPVTDLVLLDLQDDEDVPAAQLADHAPSAGSPVWLLGAPKPGTKSPWMSSGMASTDDAMVASDPGPTTSGLVETTAASSSDVVGGALVDATGSVAGIVLGHVNGSTSTYAVSIDVAVDIAQELDATGVAEHGALGVLGVNTRFGPMIVEMPHNGPAARAGVRVSDLVEAVDGRAVRTIGDVTALVQSLAPGRTVMIELRRGKRAIDVRIPLGETPARSPG